MEETATNRNEHKETNPEVSLPGSDINSIEQPTILQVLNPLNVLEEKLDKTKEKSANRIKLQKQPPSFEELQLRNDVNGNDNANFGDKNLVNHSHKTQCNSNLVITTPTLSPTPTPTPTPTSTPTSTPATSKDCKFDPYSGETIFPETHINHRKDNIFDIESHLIETYNELFPNEESVGINELAPIKDELDIGCSKIERNDNVRTVIEVEPAKVVAKKPVEEEIIAKVPLQAAHVNTLSKLSNGEHSINKGEIEKIAEHLIENIEEEITNNWNKLSSEAHLTEAAKKETHQVKVGKVLEGDEKKLLFEKAETAGSFLKEIGKGITKNEKTTAVGNPEEIPNKTTPNLKPEVETNVLPISKESTEEEKLSEVVNQQLSEVNSILDSQTKQPGPVENAKRINSQTANLPGEKHPNLKVVSVPLSKTASEEEERNLFIESLPPLEPTTTLQSSAEQLALDCKREYYQSLKKYLVQNTDKPPLPLQTYRWEDLRRAKERGGYPWTHLYKRPLGPDEQPEIVLMLRKSQEIRFTSESPKSNKKVRIDDHVSVQETERYIQELSEEDEPNTEHLCGHQDDDLENHSLHSESCSFVSDSVLTAGKQPKKSGRFNKVRRLFRRRRYGARRHDDAQSLPDSFTNSSLEQVPQGSLSLKERNKQVKELKGEAKKEDEPIYIHSKTARCFPIMKKLKSMADRQKKRLNIKRIHLGKDDKIVLNEQPKILKLKNSPKYQRSDIPHFVEKQDSDDVLEIVELDESPSRKRKDDDRFDDEERTQSSIVRPEEIIEIGDMQSAQKEANERSVENISSKTTEETDVEAVQPKKAPRLRREHVYEEIDQSDEAVVSAEELKFILDATSVDAIKQSLSTQDTSAAKEVTTADNNIPLDRMGSSEEEPIALTDRATPERKSNTLLAPISSIDSASSDEDKSKLHLQPLTEEDVDQDLDNAVEQRESDSQKNHKPSLKKEASPAPSEKKVTFSYVEDEAEPHREDVELTAEHLEATRAATKWKNTIK